MNNLAYNSQDPNVVAPKVADLVKDETGGAADYTVEEGSASPTSAKTVVLEGLDLLLGGRKATTLFTVNFSLSSPRAMSLTVPLNRQGVGCHGSGSTYVTELAKPVGSAVTLAPPKFLGGMKWEGDADAAAKLNGNGELMKRLKNFIRTKGNLGGVDITIGQHFQVVPNGSGSVLIANNMPKSMKMGFVVSFELKDFAEIAQMIENSL